MNEDRSIQSTFDELSQAERLILANMTLHEGFKIFTRIMESICTRATARVIQCDPTKEREILALQGQARAINDFCTQLRKKLLWEVSEGIYLNEHPEPAEPLDKHPFNLGESNVQ